MSSSATTAPTALRAPTAPLDVRLQGVNLGGWLIAEATPEHLAGFAGPGDFARIASWRFTHARLPVDDALLDRPEGWLALDGALMACLGAGLRCVLALRLAPRRRATLFASAEDWGHLVTRWETIARRYAGAPAFLTYDLLDEPAAPDDLPPEALAALGAVRPSPAAARRPPAPGATAGRAWNALALRLTQAVRGADAQHPIVVESNLAHAGGFTHLRPTRDPLSLYSFHCFDPPAFTRQSLPRAGAPLTYPGVVDGERWDRARLEALFQPALEFRRAYQVPLYLGAFGVASGAPRAGQLTWLRTVLSLCRAHGIGWASWTYRGGPFALIGPQGLDYELLGVLQSEA
jgi:Cellulase (glycosyl hydrolase family 5)